LEILKRGEKMTRLEKLSKIKEETRIITIKIPSSLSVILKNKAFDLGIPKSKLTHELFMIGVDELFRKDPENA
jgi:hypothetical protein